MGVKAIHAGRNLPFRSPECDLPLLTAAEEVDLAKQIEAGIYAKHLLSHGSTGGAATLDLQEIASRGDLAYERMIRSNLRLVPFVARGYLGQGLDMEELIQEGVVGLVIAVQKFDYSRGIKFSSHAVWWIRYALTTGTANIGRAIRLPREVHAGVNRLRKVRTQLAVAGKPTSLSDVAHEMGLPDEKVNELDQLSKPIASIDEFGSEGGSRSDWIEYHGSLHNPSALDVVLEQDLARELIRALSDLNVVEMRYLELLYGVDTGRPRSKFWVQKQLRLRPREASKIHAKVERVLERARTGELAMSL